MKSFIIRVQTVQVIHSQDATSEILLWVKCIYQLSTFKIQLPKHSKGFLDFMMIALINVIVYTRSVYENLAYA